MSSDEDYHLRFQVADPGLTEAQNQAYDRAMAVIIKGMQEGLAWQAIVDSVNMIEDEKFKAVILDDYVKILLAGRHFQGEESLKKIAKSTRIPMDLLVEKKAEMIEEVKQASIDAYHLTRDKENQNPH